ncbi:MULTISPECIES: GspH/FimT family pseudopilin [unclassified Halomonas]|uniref:GspH/FimT family pseudopilin n=1 Tax=unclassified Halomonas TaxID=2609666 RepID=UPI0009BEFA26|nr:MULTISPECIES: GspH/FimT family pseudopilin [unclassified Halomonas]
MMTCDTAAHPRPGSVQRGFTLLELMVALVLMAVMTAWLAPGFQALGHHSMLNSETTRLQAAFALARNTAITQRTAVTVCPANPQHTACTASWHDTLMVVKGRATDTIEPAQVLRTFPGQLATYTTYSRGWHRVTYTPLGHASGYNGSFDVCATGETGKRLVLSPLGRLRIDKTPIDC